MLEHVRIGRVTLQRNAFGVGPGRPFLEEPGSHAIALLIRVYRDHGDATPARLSPALVQLCLFVLVFQDIEALGEVLDTPQGLEGMVLEQDPESGQDAPVVDRGTRRSQADHELDVTVIVPHDRSPGRPRALRRAQSHGHVRDRVARPTGRPDHGIPAVTQIHQSQHFLQVPPGHCLELPHKLRSCFHSLLLPPVFPIFGVATKTNTVYKKTVFL